MAVAALLFFLPVKGIAAGDDSSLSVMDEDTLSPQVMDDNTLSVVLPVVPEEEPSPFDFILDPYGLVYETGALRYGGGTVEEGASMLFCNEDGEYDFSSSSDRLSVTNLSEEPVMVTISASVSDLVGIELMEKNGFFEDKDPAIYLAMTDDQGNEQPVSEDGESMIRVKLESGVYSFGLTGACSLVADWREIDICPKITVTWRVDPVKTEEKEYIQNGDIEDLVPGMEDLQESPANDIDHPVDGMTDHETGSEDIGNTGSEEAGKGTEDSASNNVEEEMDDRNRSIPENIKHE